MGFGDFIVAVWLYSFALLVFVSLFLFFMSFRYLSQQNALLYHPSIPPESRELCADPVTSGIPNAERVCITTADNVQIRGFLLWPTPPPLPEKRGDAGVPSSTAAKRVDVEAVGSGQDFQKGSSNSTVALSPRGTMPNFVLLYFHGNAGNVGHRLPLAQMLVAELNCAVMMVDYRGFGLSDDAELSQAKLELDAQACFDHLWDDPRVPRDRIVVMGTSLGGAVAIHLAAHEPYARRITAVIVENTFTSISDMVSAIGGSIITQLVTPCPRLALGVFQYYVKPLVLRIRWDSKRIVRDVVAPMLFLSGLQDELVPPAQMRVLYKASMKRLRDRNGADLAVPLRRFVEFDEGCHNNMPAMPGYMHAVTSFIADVQEASAVSVL